MKNLLIILFMLIASLAQAQVSELLIDGELMKDTTLTFTSTTRGRLDVFALTDTVYGSTKDATITISQRVYNFDRGIQLSSGFATFSDTLNGFRFIDGKTPYGYSYTDIVIKKNSIDSTRYKLGISWEKD